MDNRYDFHSYSKLYREDALREAHKRHLVGLAKANGRPGLGRGDVGFSLRSVLGSLLRVARLAG